jgi:hypothetical protein
MRQRTFEGMPIPERPKRHSKEVMKRAVELLGEKVKQWLAQYNEKLDEDGLASLLKCWDLDGYRFARRLDEDMWEPDAQLVEILNDAHFFEAQAHREAIKQWVDDWDVQPQIEEGQRVMLNGKAIGLEGNYSAHIRRVDLSSAQYTLGIPDAFPDHISQEKFEAEEWELSDGTSHGK